jgi:hypothetical protein
MDYPTLAHGIQFVEQKYASRRFREMEDLSKMNSGLANVDSDHGVESDQE